MPTALPFALDHLRAGDRIAVAVSGGADSVALLRSLHAGAGEHGFVLRVAHFNHQLRGDDSRADEQFVRELSQSLDLPFFSSTADTATHARSQRQSIEEAARNLRYQWFRELLANNEANVIATAHTLDDQAETVLLKWLRGAWTEGLGGISPMLQQAHGRIVRPMLQVRRNRVEQYLRELGQPWRDDATNSDTRFTRNRMRHELMPLLRDFNPNVEEQLARVSEIARDEESYWEIELRRVLPQLLLHGRAVRGGGRAVPTGPHQPSVSLDVTRIAALTPAVQRRVLRAAASQLGHSLDFFATERLRSLLTSRGGAKATLSEELIAERTPRELRIFTEDAIASNQSAPEPAMCSVPGTTDAPVFGLRVAAEYSQPSSPATLRCWKAGDRVRLRHSLSEKKVKEVLQRLRAPAQDKRTWPVLEWSATIVWMRGAEVECPTDFPRFAVTDMPLPSRTGISD